MKLAQNLSKKGQKGKHTFPLATRPTLKSQIECHFHTQKSFGLYKKLNNNNKNNNNNNQQFVNKNNQQQQTTRHFTSTAATPKVFLVAGKRTPFGKFGESLKSHSPLQLSLHAAQALLTSTHTSPQAIDHIVYANVIPSTPATLYAARHLAVQLGARLETPGVAVNRLCGSGVQAIVDAKHMILRGEADMVLVAGAENMSMAPHATYGARFGTRYGGLKTVDFLLDTLTDEGCKTPMAITAENLAAKYGITRQAADEFSLNSHLKATKAYQEGHLQDEIAPVALKKSSVEIDEHVRQNCKIEDMTKLKPAFKEGGTVTPATASGVVDGGAAVMIASEKFVQQNNLEPLAEVGQWAVVGVEPTEMGIGPSPAIHKLLQKTGKSLADYDLFEINEAFAAQALAVAKDLNLDESKLNIWGGATAIGHPLGATGIRISLTLSRQLQKKGLKAGIASACIGGGQGIALELIR